MDMSEELELIKDSYEIVEKLGNGSFGNVYLMISKQETKTNVAIKVYNISNVSKILIKGIYEEIKILNMLSNYCNKYVVCYDKSLKSKDYIYIIMEYKEDYIVLTSINKSVILDNICVIAIELMMG